MIHPQATTGVHVYTVGRLPIVLPHPEQVRDLGKQIAADPLVGEEPGPHSSGEPAGDVAETLIGEEPRPRRFGEPGTGRIVLGVPTRGQLACGADLEDSPAERPTEHLRESAPDADLAVVRVLDTTTNERVGLIPYGRRGQPSWLLAEDTVPLERCGNAPIVGTDGVLYPGSDGWHSQVNTVVDKYLRFHREFDRAHRERYATGLEERWSAAIDNALQTLGLTPTFPIPTWLLTIAERTAP